MTTSKMSLSFFQRHEQTRKFLERSCALLECGSSKRLYSMLDGLSLVLETHSCPPLLVSQFITSIVDWCGKSEEGIFVKQMKYLTCWPIAQLLHFTPKGGEKFVELPTCPTDKPRFASSLKKWMKARLNAYNTENVHLWYSFLQAKRCAEPLSEEIVWGKFVDHCKTLESDDPCADWDLTQTFDEDDDYFVKQVTPGTHLIEDEIDLISRSVDWSYVYDSYLDPYRRLSASISAGFNAPRCSGGQRRLIRWIACQSTISDALKALTSQPSMDDLLGIWTPVISIRSEYRPWCMTRTGRRYNQVVWDMRRETSFDLPASLGWDGHPLFRCRTGGEALLDHIRACFLLDPHCVAAGNELPWARIQAVLEPLKARIISCGPSALYYSCRALQKELWSAMQALNCFQLTGRPVRPSDIELIRDNPMEEVLINGDDMVYFTADGCCISVDYEGATDNSSQKMGFEILTELLARNPRWGMNRSYLACFGPHTLYYRTKDNCMVGTQENGQLMGSILSFPILCLLNLITFRCVQGHDRLSYRHNRQYSGIDLFQVHKRVAGSIGLKMSLGKAYVHPRYCNVNSTCFDVRRNSVKEIPYLNVSLVLGKHKVQEKSKYGEDEESEEEIGRGVGHWNKFVLGCPKDVQRDFWGLFMLHNRELLDAESRKWRNYFLPCSAGGLGLVKPRGVPLRTTHVQRAYYRVHRIFLSENGYDLSVRPTPGPEFQFDPIDWGENCGLVFYDDLCQARPEVSKNNRMDRAYKEVCRAVRADPSLGCSVKILQLEEVLFRTGLPCSGHGVTEFESPKTVGADLAPSIIPYQENPGFVSNKINTCFTPFSDVREGGYLLRVVFEAIPPWHNLPEREGDPVVLCSTIDQAARWCDRTC